MAEVVHGPPPDEPPDDPGPRAGKSVAAQLVAMAQQSYRLGISDMGEPYGTHVDTPHLAMPLKGGKLGLRQALARRYATANGNTPPSGQALADTMMVLEGAAAEQVPQRLHLRVADQGGRIYLDMGDTDGQVIVIGGGSWSMTDAAPVLFRRTALTMPYTNPVAEGGEVGRLWEFVHIAPEDRPVLLAVLIQALIQPDAPHPVLTLLAEQGSAKSTITRMLVDLLDPASVPLRAAPRDPDNWAVAAMASWVVALDNLAGTLPEWLSNALCRAVTGDGIVKRMLYTDSDVSIQAFRRCLIINGIDLVISAGDLAERVVTMNLPRITIRRDEHDIESAWEQARPVIMGGLLDLAARVHQALPNVIVPDLPRMADFARVLGTLDAIFGTDGLGRYREQAKAIARGTLTSEFVRALIAAAERGEAWGEITSAELLIELAPDGEKPPRGWPKSARTVDNQLTRHAPALRQLGWYIDHDEGKNKNGVRRWTIDPPHGGSKVRESDPPNPPGPSPQVNDTKSGGSDIDGEIPSNQLTRQARSDGGSGGAEAGQAKTANPPKNRSVTRQGGPGGSGGSDSEQLHTAMDAEIRTVEGWPACEVCGQPITTGVGTAHLGCQQIVDGPTASRWLNDHIANLQQAGETVFDARDVYAAAATAGHDKAAIKQAIAELAECDELQLIESSGTRRIWLIETGGVA